MKKTILLISTAFAFMLLVNMSSIAQNQVTNGDLELWDNPNTPTGWDKTESIVQEATIIHGGVYSAKQQAGTNDLMQNVSGIVESRAQT